MKTKSRVSAAILILTSVPLFSGFPAGTLVKTGIGYKHIEQLEVGDNIFSCDLKNKFFDKKIIQKKSYKKQKCICIVTNSEEIIASPNQKFYIPDTKTWKKAKDLKIGDVLLKNFDEYEIIENLFNIEKELKLFDLSIEKPNTFLVTKSNILVHNFFPVIALSFAFGGGVVEFLLGASLAATATGIATIAAKKLLTPKQKTHNQNFYNYTPPNNDDDNNNKKKKTSDSKTNAKAPGKPTKKENFCPKKRWDGKKVKVQKGKFKGRYGYPDKKGNIWVPTGHEGHGGAHWDVQSACGKKYWNIFLVG